MLPYLLRRLFSAALILLGLSLLVYLLIYLSPADPAQVIAGQRLGGPARSEDIAQVRREYGLDRPIPLQYLSWLGQALRGDFGYSVRSERLISSELQSRVGFSMLLGTAAMALVLLLGTALGTWAALKPNSVADHVIRITGLVWVAIPDFWLAFLLILIFAVYLGILPSFGARSGLHLILPAVTLAGPQAARLSQLLRSILQDVLRQDYMRTAAAKGLPEFRAVVSPRDAQHRRALRNGRSLSVQRADQRHYHHRDGVFVAGTGQLLHRGGQYPRPAGHSGDGAGLWRNHRVLQSAGRSCLWDTRSTPAVELA